MLLHRHRPKDSIDLDEVCQGLAWETDPNCLIDVKAISVLGSTGSIGTQTLDIARDFPDQYKVVALTAGRNLALLVEQIQEHRPEVVALADTALLPELQERLKAAGVDEAATPQLVGGPDGLNVAASWESADLVVTGIVGCAGLLPTLAAIRAGKDLALANKETLIAAGPVVLPELKKSGSRLLPADSEHSAIFQCLQGTPWADNARLSTGVPTPGLRRIQLTASGGAFRDWDARDLEKATVADATSHPNWSMGRKITVDSASLMNKGLEVIEAHYLFGLDYDHIEIVIHPQSIIHSMIELATGLARHEAADPLLLELAGTPGNPLAAPRSHRSWPAELPQTRSSQISLHGAGLRRRPGRRNHAGGDECRQRRGCGSVPRGEDPLPRYPCGDRSGLRTPQSRPDRPSPTR